LENGKMCRVKTFLNSGIGLLFLLVPFNYLSRTEYGIIIIVIFVTILTTTVTHPIAYSKNSSELYSVTLKQDYLQ
jgi:hypothetical protein